MRFYIWLGILLLGACRQTDIPEGLPIWRGTYIVWQQDSLPHLGVWDGETWRPAVESTWLAGGSALKQIAADQDCLWILGQQPTTLNRIDLATESIAKQLSDIPLPTPTQLAVGPDNILVGDSLAAALAFWLNRQENWIEVEPLASPTEILYRAGRYYIATTAPAVEVWHAQSLSRIANIPFEGQILSIQADARNSVWVQTLSGGEIREASIEINSQTIQSASTASRFLAVQYSPYIRQQFGTEYTRTVVRSSDEVIRPGNIRNAPSFRTDFLGGEIYYVQADSLRRYNIQQNTHTRLDALQGTMHQMYAWWDFGLK
ncbi:MAG: hypothetical protein AAFV07_03565 [Bacteroidota bacterium]